MARKWFWFVLALPVLLLSNIAISKDEFFRLEDVRPGMKGIGKTCFQGMKPEEFQAEMLGVLHGVNPGTSAILARLSGGMLDRVGVFEGMSGSPVYIDGKLLGAVAFSFPYAKEAIAGITPIAQMVGAFTETIDASRQIRVILQKSVLWKYRQLAPRQQDNLLLPAAVSRGSEIPQSLASLGGHALIPISTPLSLGGLHPATVKAFAPQFRAMGMSYLQGVGSTGLNAASNTAQETSMPPLEPGSNIVVPLIRGDLDVSAGGTVTYIDGAKLYAFGHNMYELGYTELPMHNGRAVLVFPSLESSFKILEIGELVGAIRQDRGVGIYGILGEKPRMVPLQIHLTTSRGVKKDYKYELARDALLTPTLLNLAIYNTLVSSERAQGAVTFEVKGKINIKGEQSVEIDNRFSSDSDAPSVASLSVAVPVNFLMSPGYKNLDLETVDLDIAVKEDNLAAALDSIRLDRTEARAGESLELEIACQKADGEMIRETYPIKIPENIPYGSLAMLVADGTTLMSIDEREEGGDIIPQDLAQLIKLINNLRKNDRLYVRLYRQAPGLAVKGEGLPGLPPSMLSILKSARKAGAMNSISSSTLMEYELPAADYIAAGAKMIKLTIKP